MNVQMPEFNTEQISECCGSTLWCPAGSIASDMSPWFCFNCDKAYRKVDGQYVLITR